MPTTLTIGMATHNDFDGLYFSLQALRMYHSNVMDRVDLVVVDNDPTSRAGEQARGLFAHINAGLTDGNRRLKQPRSARLIAAPEVVGTSAPRQRIFTEATTDAVLVLDSHVLLWPGAIEALLDYYDQNPATPDLLTGPLMYDNLGGALTHFNDVWRDGMWGTWGANPHGRETTSPPFEIGAQGLGLFSCRRAAWLGFNPAFREFGGEEWYIHTKFRQAGARCLNLPALRWVHRFGDPPGGRKSPLSLRGKVRNYVIGHMELNLDMARLRTHFVESTNEDDAEPVSRDQRMTPAEFDLLVCEATVLKSRGWQS
jgi:hypothetical protein